jgi:DNA-binding XRE family transcriptional regulator
MRLSKRLKTLGLKMNTMLNNNWHSTTNDKKLGAVSSVLFFATTLLGTGSDTSNERYFNEVMVARAGISPAKIIKNNQATPGAVSIQAKLEHLLIKLQISKAVLANLMGVTRQTINDWENGSKLRTDKYKNLNALELFASEMEKNLGAIPLFWEGELLEGGLTVLDSFKAKIPAHEIIKKMLQKNRIYTQQSKALKEMFGDRYYSNAGG